MQVAQLFSLQLGLLPPSQFGDAYELDGDTLRFLRSMTLRHDGDLPRPPSRSPEGLAELDSALLVMSASTALIVVVEPLEPIPSGLPSTT